MYDHIWLQNNSKNNQSIRKLWGFIFSFLNSERRCWIYWFAAKAILHFLLVHDWGWWEMTVHSTVGLFFTSAFTSDHLLYGPRCPLSPERLLNLITHSLSHWDHLEKPQLLSVTVQVHYNTSNCLQTCSLCTMAYPWAWDMGWFCTFGFWSRLDLCNC